FIRQGNGAGGFLAETVLGNPSAIAGGEFGFAVALGNFDGATDASLEILVGEPDDPAGGTTRGSFHAYNAPPPAFSETVLGAANGESQGASVATGNLNPAADAFDDFLIGIPGVDDGGVRRGRFGRSLSDGVAAPFGGALVTFPATFVENNANFGFPIATGNYDAASGADLLVGQHLADPFALIDAGRAEAVFSNGVGGFAASTVLFEPFTEAGAWFGFAVSTGDLNFDGFRDAYVGAPRGTGSGAMPLAGEVHLFRFVGGITFVYHETLRELVPEAGANFGFGVLAADLSNDGLADVVIANPGAAGGGGEVFIYYQPR
ncbi:MAG: FG-GAP repeat protein, partial [Planctomycetes bacterium]|nr:FG-GAP repeat protein [Planctomycetota bacterium]